MGTPTKAPVKLRRLVSDIGPLLHLFEIQALDLLEKAGQIYIPKGVESEITLRAPSWSAPAAATDYVSRERADNLLKSLSHSSLWISARVLKEANAALARIFGD